MSIRVIELVWVWVGLLDNLGPDEGAETIAVEVGIVRVEKLVT